MVSSPIDHSVQGPSILIIFWHVYGRTGRRLQWLKTRLDVTQWEEEVEILNSEMRRVFQFNCTLHTTWIKLANANPSKAGFEEYAKQAANVYAMRASECERRFALAKEHGCNLPPACYTV